MPPVIRDTITQRDDRTDNGTTDSFNAWLDSG